MLAFICGDRADARCGRVYARPGHCSILGALPEPTRSPGQALSDPLERTGLRDHPADACGSIDRRCAPPRRYPPIHRRLRIPYTDSAANLRYYEPDFVAVTSGGAHHLLETKGRQDIDVKHKDRAAQLWCENASRLTGAEWLYKKVLQKEFEQLVPDDFEDLIAL